jgi:hypothetical protein
MSIDDAHRYGLSASRTLLVRNREVKSAMRRMLVFELFASFGLLCAFTSVRAQVAPCEFDDQQRIAFPVGTAIAEIACKEHAD